MSNISNQNCTVRTTLDESLMRTSTVGFRIALAMWGSITLKPFTTDLEFLTRFLYEIFISQLLAMDASARVTMKDAAKCDKRREWQNSVNQENAERILHFQATSESMSVSGR